MSEDLAAKVRRRIEEIVSRTDGDPVLQTLVCRYSMIPMCVDAGGGLALRSDGEIVQFLWDEPVAPVLCTDVRVRNMALFQGSLLYPELATLVPVRPTTAVTCHRCRGTGDTGLGERFVCFCGGLGWLPAASGQ